MPKFQNIQMPFQPILKFCFQKHTNCVQQKIFKLEPSSIPWRCSCMVEVENKQKD